MQIILIACFHLQVLQKIIAANGVVGLHLKITEGETTFCIIQVIGNEIGTDIGREPCVAPFVGEFE